MGAGTGGLILAKLVASCHADHQSVSAVRTPPSTAAAAAPAGARMDQLYAANKSVDAGTV